jgi:DNA-directed RNA polymerase sigma subunit (sigma70/sigma32)
VSAEKALARLRELVAEIAEAEERATDLRAELRVTIMAAREAGLSQAAIGRELGISRQRVRQILDKPE